MTFSDYGLPRNQGGLTAQDFAGANGDLTPEQFFAFYTTMGVLLSLTAEQKKVNYVVKGSSQNILPLGI